VLGKSVVQYREVQLAHHVLSVLITPIFIHKNSTAVQHFHISWSPISVPLFQPFVTGSDQQPEDHMTSKLVSNHSPPILQITPTCLKLFHLVRFVAFVRYWIRLSFSYFMLPQTVCTLLKKHTCVLHTSKFTVYLSYWYFVKFLRPQRNCTLKMHFDVHNGFITWNESHISRLHCVLLLPNLWKQKEWQPS
jgi:hypothetical protein